MDGRSASLHFDLISVSLKEVYKRQVQLIPETTNPVLCGRFGLKCHRFETNWTAESPGGHHTCSMETLRYALLLFLFFRFESIATTNCFGTGWNSFVVCESPERFCVSLMRRKWVRFKFWVNYPFESLVLFEETHTQLPQVSKGCSLFPFQTPSPASCPNGLPVSLCEMSRRLALPSGQGAAAGTNESISLC